MCIEILSPTFFLFILLFFVIGHLSGRCNKIEGSNEEVFLESLINHYNYWLEKGEKEYAEAYKGLIHKFTKISDEA